jgi:hypothetical protein
MVALNDINELIAKKALSTDQLIKLKEYIKLVMDDENKFYNDEILSSWFRDIRLNN